MSYIKRKLEIKYTSNFSIELTINFDYAIDLCELKNLATSCEGLLDELVVQFKAVCEANGFKYVELYKRYATLKDNAITAWTHGDLHEPFTDYLVEKLKADARLEIATKS